MSSEDKNQTILSSKRNWERWLRPIKSKALGTEVWEYINPDLTLPANGAASPSDEELADNTRKYGKRLVKPEVLTRLEGESDIALALRHEAYKQARDEYKTDRANIAAIREHIFKTIDQSANLLVEDKTSVRDILSELQKRYKPDTNQEQFDILNKWTLLKTEPAGKRQLNAWIKDWIETYNHARQHKIPGIGMDEKYAMLEFMLAIQQSYDVFYSTWYEAVYNNRETSFVELITKFEDFTKSERGGSAYATFGGNKTYSNEPHQDNSNKDKLCPCGQPKTIHPRWEECEYLNEQIRQDDWTADPSIINKITEKAASWKGLKNFIDQHKKQERPPVTVHTVFRAIRGTDPLMNSVIHDSGATESISNDISRMEDFVPERIQIRGFGGSIWAKGRGTMIVWAAAPGDKEKSQELRIRNALYCPDGPTSLISGKALNRNGIFKDEEKNVLYTRKGGYQVIAKLRSINDQAVIEYNPPNQASAYTLKAPKLLTKNEKQVYRTCSSKGRAPRSQGVVDQAGQNKLNRSSDSQNKLNFKLTSTTSFDNRASRLPTPSLPDFEHRQEVVAHTGTEGEYAAPITTERSNVETKATPSETNITSGKRNQRAPKHNVAVAYFTSTFASGRVTQDEQKPIPEARLHRYKLPSEQAINMPRNNEAIQICLCHINTHNHWLHKKWHKTRKSTSAGSLSLPHQPTASQSLSSLRSMLDS